MVRVWDMMAVQLQNRRLMKGAQPCPLWMRALPLALVLELRPTLPSPSAVSANASLTKLESCWAVEEARQANE